MHRAAVVFHECIAFHYVLKIFVYFTQGVPIRIELGPRDIQNKQFVAVRRDTLQKVIAFLSSHFHIIFLNRSQGNFLGMKT